MFPIGQQILRVFCLKSYKCESLFSALLIKVTALSMSSSDVSNPRLNLIEASASSLDMPIALRTCEGSGIPEVHAEPVDAARLG